MLLYLLGRILGLIPVLLAIITITFFMIRLAPGGPFASEKDIPREILLNLRKHYNLEKPLHKQYFLYLNNLLHGDLGPSFRYPGRSVNELISSGFPVSLELGLYSLIFALLIGCIAGILGALRPNSIQDHTITIVSLIGICVPALLLGPLLLLIFGIQLQILPVSGWDSPLSKILPSITLGASTAAFISRLSRGGIQEILAQDFIRTARASGQKEILIILRHTLRGGLLPVVSYLGPAAAALLSGSFLVETIFQIPGLGRSYIQAAFNRDYTMILGTTIFFAVLITIFNMLSDVLLVQLDPKIGYDDDAKS